MHATWFDGVLCVYQTNAVAGHKLLHTLLCRPAMARTWLDKHYPGIRLLVIE